jgi:hypothetical protein
MLNRAINFGERGFIFERKYDKLNCILVNIKYYHLIAFFSAAFENFLGKYSNFYLMFND